MIAGGAAYSSLELFEGFWQDPEWIQSPQELVKEKKARGRVQLGRRWVVVVVGANVCGAFVQAGEERRQEARVPLGRAQRPAAFRVHAALDSVAFVAVALAVIVAVTAGVARVAIMVGVAAIAAASNTVVAVAVAVLTATMRR